jgi:hypothetical protein
LTSMSVFSSRSVSVFFPTERNRSTFCTNLWFFEQCYVQHEHVLGCK